MDDIERYMKIAESLVPSETLFAEALKDLMKDEIKNYLKQKLDNNPDVKKEISDAVLEYLEAKLKEAMAITKISKAATRLGLIALPEYIKSGLVKDLVELFKEEIDKTIEKTL